MEDKSNLDSQYVQPNNKITLEMRKKAKIVVEDAKKKGNIQSHTTAFDKFPACNEVHKGKEDYYLDN